MYSCPPCANQAIPGEYRKIAEELFPPGGFPHGGPCEGGPSVEAAGAFAGILGIEGDYQRALTVPLSDPKIDELLWSFRNNLDLLIQKTWVEKVDELRKEKLQDRIPPLISLIKQGALREALEEFASVLEELAYLLFGAQSCKEDFTEYALRIDTQMGLFWWYGGQIGSGGLNRWLKAADQESLRAILLLGICYLTDF